MKLWGIILGALLCLGIAPALAAPIPAASFDFSANTPAIPNVGANFAASGPYANYVLIATAPANQARHKIEVENLSGAQIVIIRDDGTAGGGSAPTNASLLAISGGASIGAQGGLWWSDTFKGRIQVYAPLSNAQVAVNGD